MPIGGGGDGGGSEVTARVPGAVRVPQQQWHFDGGGQVDECHEAVANAIGTHPPVSDAGGTEAPVAKPVSSQPVEGGGRSGNNGTGEEIDAAPGHRQPGDNHHGAAGEVAGAGVSRMTVAMPRDHTGAFHVGVFGRERHKTATSGGTARGGTINIKAVAWCPAVVVPPRLPLCGHLPRGQRRDLRLLGRTSSSSKRGSR
ncbi:unnamed protein product [Ectocarpus sp. 12 AP-2014]